MVAPGRSPLAGFAEVDETEIPLRTKDDPVAGGGGRSHRGKMRSRKRRARPHSSRRDHGLLRSRAARLHRRQRGSRHHDPHRRLVGLSRRAGCRPRSPCHRSDRRPCGAAVDPPRLLQPEDLGRLPPVCARNTCRPISTNSFSVSIAVAPATPLSPRSSASASQSHPPPTQC